MYRWAIWWSFVVVVVSRVHVHRVHGPSAPAPRASGARRGEPVEPIGGRAQLILVVGVGATKPSTPKRGLLQSSEAVSSFD